MAVYKLSENAAEKIASVYEYSLLNFGEAVADEYYTSLHRAFELLANQPYLGRAFHEFYRHDHRHHVFFYKATDYGILILHILHEKENVEDQIQ